MFACVKTLYNRNKVQWDLSDYVINIIVTKDEKARNHFFKKISLMTTVYNI